MKRNAVWIVALTLVYSTLAFAGEENKTKFVGVKMCAPCHKGETKGKMFEIWQGSKHANAFKTLLSDEAKKIGEAKGLKNAPSESPECLKCHVTGHGEDPARFAATYDPKDGITCESCHGAGDAYKGMAVMKDRVKAMTAGLILGANDPKLCTGCHNIESPTFKDFSYEEYWSKIKHPRPKK